MAVHMSHAQEQSGNETRRASGKPAPTYRGAKVSVADLPQNAGGNEFGAIDGPWPPTGSGTPSRDKLVENKATDKNIWPKSPAHRSQK